MIQKNKLISELGKMTACKERIAVLAKQNLSSAIQLAVQENKNQKEILALFQKIEARQARHIEIIRQIQRDMEEYPSDVY